jgi:hypothetical protein
VSLHALDVSQRLLQHSFVFDAREPVRVESNTGNHPAFSGERVVAFVEGLGRAFGMPVPSIFSDPIVTRPTSDRSVSHANTAFRSSSVADPQPNLVM